MGRILLGSFQGREDSSTTGYREDSPAFLLEKSGGWWHAPTLPFFQGVFPGNPKSHVKKWRARFRKRAALRLCNGIHQVCGEVTSM